MKIKEMPNNERPVERLITDGSENLSMAELLAIILKTGSKDVSAKDLAYKVLNDCPNLETSSLNKLTKIKGIGVKKAATIMAALELSKRINQELNIFNTNKITSSEMVFNYYKNKVRTLKQEHFWVIYLDNKKRIIKESLLFKGTINQSLVHPREIFKEAYILSASSIICVHNHPSLDESPSNEDFLVTKRLFEIGNLLGIELLDHIIIGNNYYSFYDNGRIK